MLYIHVYTVISNYFYRYNILYIYIYNLYTKLYIVNL